jgi:NAD(P)H-nitrite reductase large subunit
MRLWYMKKDKGYCIIGNSAAAIAAVEAIIRNDKEGQITMISDESRFAYSRPLISDLLSGKVTAGGMFYRDEDFYSENEVNLLWKKVTGIDTKDKIVILEDDERISYDKLLIATGGIPILPRIKGLERESVFTFTKWDDVSKIEEMIKRAKNSVVIGGGLIGLKAAESLREVGIEVTVVELADRILSPVLNERASKIVEDHLIENGVRIIKENTVDEITVDGVILRDGKRIECESVIVAIGVGPNIEIVSGTGILVNRGIIVDEHMETSIRDIFAAGDVAEAYDTLYGERRVIPICPLAREQGTIAGYNMSGSESRYKGGFGMNSIELFGLPMISVGIANEDDGYEILEKEDDKGYRRIVLKDNIIVGAIFVECIDRAGIITGLIKDKIEVEEFKDVLLDDNFGYVSFPKELREERLND